MKAVEFGEYIRTLRKEKKMTIRQLELYSGVSNSYLSLLENGKRDIPSPDILKKLHKPLGASYEELMVKAGYIQNVTINAPTASSKLDANPPNIEPYNPDDMIKVPVLGSIRAGEPMDRVEYIEGYALVDPTILRGREGFALRVKGDSMIGDRIHEGDIVICVKQDESESSQIAVVAVDAEFATLKRVKCENGMCILSPSNPKYQPFLIPADKTHIIGVVVQIQINF